MILLIFFLTGDECWINYSYSSIHTWTLSIDDVDNIERTNQFQKKILITIFINGNDLISLSVIQTTTLRSLPVVHF